MSTATLARQAERLALGDHLLLGTGEEKTGGRRKQALLADGYEALIAAIYLDGGVEQARAFIAARIRRPRRGREASTGSGATISSRRCRSTCSRGISRCPSTGWPATAGPDHQKCFTCRVVVRRQPMAEASGPSKKEAEQEAARRRSRN